MKTTDPTASAPPSLSARNPRKIKGLAALALLAIGGGAAAAAAGGCAQTQHPLAPAPALHGGSGATSFEALLAAFDEPGPIRFEKHVAADWRIPRAGLLNLDHPKAQAAHLEDELESIKVFFYLLGHPQYGDFLVDSGIARSVADGQDMPVRFPVNWALPTDELEVRLDTKTYLESRSSPLAGVFLTHLHLDHILGLEDIPQDTPLYVGPGEATDARPTHLLMRPTTDLNLSGFGPLREWQVVTQPGAPLAFVDIFGDGSVVGLHVPGHTAGSMAFLVRSQDGAQLLVGDGSHTAWGWEHGVEPGTFNTDMQAAAASLKALKKLATRIDHLQIHLGHQHLGAHKEESRARL